MDIDAVLSQRDNRGQVRVNAYRSRLLSMPEWQYCFTRQELVAVVLFTLHFRSFFQGDIFTLWTGHGSLTWLKNFKEPEGSQMTKWLEQLQKLHFTIVHQRGKNYSFTASVVGKIMVKKPL